MKKCRETDRTAIRDAAKGGRKPVAQKLSQRLAIVLAISGGLAIAIVGTPGTSAGRSRAISETTATGCVTPDPETIRYVDSMVVSGDSILGFGLRGVTNLPAGSVSSVSAVTDSTICHQAAVASGLAQNTPDSLAVSDVSVLRVGATRYVVNVIGEKMGEFGVHLTFDTTFALPPLAVWAH